MAVIIAEKKGMNLVIGAAVAAGVVVIGVIMYYLFFKPVPGIENFIDSADLKNQLNTISEISALTFDVKEIEASPIYLMLLNSESAGSPATDRSGRKSPFEPF